LLIFFEDTFLKIAIFFWNVTLCTNIFLMYNINDNIILWHIKKSPDIIYSTLNNFRCFIYALFANSTMDLLLLLRKHHILHVTHITACTEPQKIVYMTSGYWVRRNNTIQYGDYGILGCDTMIYLLLGTSILTKAPTSSNFREKHCFHYDSGGSRFLQNVGIYP